MEVKSAEVVKVPLSWCEYLKGRKGEEGRRRGGAPYEYRNEKEVIYKK